MARLTVMMLMAVVASCLAMPNFDGIEQKPMDDDGTKTVSKKGSSPTKGKSQPDPPFGTCDTYQVTFGNSSEERLIQQGIVVAIFPSESFANVEVHMDDIMYMVCVQGSMVNLTKCDSEGEECKPVDVNSAKRLDILTPHQWNYVNITISETQIDVSINSKKLTGMLMDALVANVTVQVDGKDPEVPRNYRALVQYSCEVPATVIPVTRSPGDEEGTAVPQTGTTGEPEEEEGPNVGLIVGILAAVIIVAVIVAVIYSKKVRKSADINAQTPLQQQQ
ncbi:uncharacterized protein LOC143026401 [Oratosquilla oratoria]|uniref:uncharacterized protein LOC143026401 n=1 Tax=Oratosquilla oratoria TaxID=337810 RepID=UPI003F761E57